MVDESETNLQGARRDRQWFAEKAALTTIGKATGLLDEGPQSIPAAITKVTVVLNHSSERNVIEGERVE